MEHNHDNNDTTALQGCAKYPHFPNAQLKDGFCAFEYPIKGIQPRMVVSLGTSDALILDRESESVVLLTDTTNDGVPDTKRTILTAPFLNHGLALHNNHIYASSDALVYRWAYTHSTDGSKLFTTIDENPTIVIDNINANGFGGAPEGHRTRTLIFDDSSTLYVSVGSANNVDDDSFRARIRRFDVSDEFTFPLNFLKGEVFADGVRNEVGLAFDGFGVLWGVENGPDKLQRDDLGDDIYNNNPAEELNRFPESSKGKHYGYPYCWSEYLLDPDKSLGRGSVWAWPASFNEEYTDEQCNADGTFEKSLLAMQAHSAPLGITFYHYKDNSLTPEGCHGATPFPQSMDGHAFIAFHGSWNRDTPTGYKIVTVPIGGIDGSEVLGPPIDLLAHKGSKAKWESGFRPVDVVFDDCGRLIVSSDGSRDVGGAAVVRIEYGESLTSSAGGFGDSSIWVVWSVLLMGFWSLRWV